MAKKTKKGDNEKGIDLEMIRHFMLDGIVTKDDSLSPKSSGTVDLHLDETSKEYDFLSDGEKLNIQIKHLEKQLDRAIASGHVKLHVIHGKGAGKLQSAVRDYLKNHPRVRSFSTMKGKKYDGGATEVFFK